VANSRRGQFYALAEIVNFDENGLWPFDSVRFSRHGTLLNTAEASSIKLPPATLPGNWKRYFRSGPESLKLGRGECHQIAEFLQLDAHGGPGASPTGSS